MGRHRSPICPRCKKREKKTPDDPYCRLCGNELSSFYQKRKREKRGIVDTGTFACVSHEALENSLNEVFGGIPDAKEESDDLSDLQQEEESEGSGLVSDLS